MTFAGVNLIATTRIEKWRWISAAGAAGASTAAVVLEVRLMMTNPVALVALVVLVGIATLLRPRLLRRTNAQR